MFPNHHDVYMHDTNDKYLFDDTERTFSHGCIRVRNPERFAEVILGEVEGWSADSVARQLKVKTTTRIDLGTQLPVHNTYLTTWVNPDRLCRAIQGRLRPRQALQRCARRQIDQIDCLARSGARPQAAERRTAEGVATSHR